MNYGLYLSAAGALSNLHRQDVLVNNLANVRTVAFKPDTVVTRQRDPERLEDPTAFADPQLLLENLGGGVLSEPTRVQFRQGRLQETGNSFDVAIEGEGFFVVRPEGAGGDREIRLTRDGRFTRNERGELAMATTGMLVLDDQNQPIVVDEREPVVIDSHGQLIQGEQKIATIQVASPPDQGSLIKDGDNLYRADDGAIARRRPAAGRLVQRHVETSGVDPIMTLNDLINATKGAMANARAMQFHDNIMGQAINTFGRVT